MTKRPHWVSDVLDWTKAIVLVLLFFGIAAWGVWLTCRNYRECRQFGHSFLYCATSGSQ